MKAETFEQKRMVELSRELDRERQRNKVLVNETHELAEKIKEQNKQNDDLYNQVDSQRLRNQKLANELKEKQHEYELLKLQHEATQERAEKTEVENVRQRQKIDELKQQMLKYQNRMKDLLFVKEKQLNDKDKDNFKLREENIEVEKLYLKQRQELQKKEAKSFKAITKMKTDLDQYRKDLESLNSYFRKNIEHEQKRSAQQISKVQVEIKRIEDLLEGQKKLKAQIRSLRGKLDEVVAENSQKIIQLYRFKNFI